MEYHDDNVDQNGSNNNSIKQQELIEISSVLRRTSESSLNSLESINEPNRKRLKVMEQTKYSMYNDFEDTAILKKRESLNYRRQRISELRSKISTLITKKEEHELRNYELEEKYSSLKKGLALIESQIEEINDIGQSSMERLREKLVVEKKAARANHDQQVNSMKEKYTAEAETIINKYEQEYAEKLKTLVAQSNHLKGEIKSEDQEHNRNLIKLKEDYHKKLISESTKIDENIRHIKDKLVNEELEIKRKAIDYKNTEDILKNDLTSTNTRLNGLYSQISSKFSNKESEIDLLRHTIINKKNQIDEITSNFNLKSNKITEHKQKVELINKKLTNYENKRRYLHNRLQELKGNIRVFCRVRYVPESIDKLSLIEIADDDINENANQEIIISKNQDDGSKYSNSYGLSNINNNSYTFQFDKVFNMNSTNAGIFEEISQLIQSSLDGYNVCVFAYGQTGSGKTYTMSQPQDGMIPLSLNKIFEDIEDLKSKGWSYTVEGQFIEIYNENIIDLLTPNGINGKYEIKHDDIENKTIVTNVQTIQLKSESHANSILETATRNRSTASTKANDRSSRSHSIYIFKLQGINSAKGISCQGTLNLIDLAGSERLVSSQAKGDRLKETQAINKSLSCLGDVIYALGQKQNNGGQHIPYRNSKLTYLLKHSLGGNSKTLMFVNVSPLQKNLNETINSLRFATKVNTTKLQPSRPSSR
ncbi:P-loop containing nucleoside triphosphate hydrolase protein [Scheffersomyces amazonensis]|uniref:P-loop containing nucleoside triphosphate hydrolase protein n=1 Tax=Scheffersomyces amazonensis TaxID=1078765 RepID=UPI00315CD8CB